MTPAQVWQTIGLDLKRTGQYLFTGFSKKAQYYFAEAKNLVTNNYPSPSQFIKPLQIIDLEGDNLSTAQAEDFITAGSIIFLRASKLV